jgi:hypothetical protein
VLRQPGLETLIVENVRAGHFSHKDWRLLFIDILLKVFKEVLTDIAFQLRGFIVVNAFLRQRLKCLLGSRGRSETTIRVR